MKLYGRVDLASALANESLAYAKAAGDPWTLAMAAHVRNWSTMLNGLQVDKVAFKQDVDKLVKNAKKSMPKTASERW